ncbi:Permease of the drug/metabolite transporter (DMT) superfamily [Sphingomonas sp. NFR04]|uniref:DMT family transporter n=1 Tax=Sphingomonas sp. NFR04 TaxID=1566283 RepID=UPI0008E1BE74|nr:EamA family transporter [Sphingomonas sp. NFR04]SFK01690.1 Permease of the drug/metabolite transporter (DMT) superfamily [Sphingomonas sp. NFR04]
MIGADTPRSARLTVLIPFLLVTLIWGSTWLVIKDQLAVVPPSWSVSYRFLVAGVTTLLWAAFRGDRLLLDARGLAFAACLGLAQFVLNFNFVYRAESHVTSGVVAVVYALLLVPNAILARIFLGQKMGRQLLIGSVVAMAGVALLFLHEARLNPVGPHEALLGIGIALAGVLSASVANVMQATGTAKAYPMATTLGWAMLVGSALDAGFALATVGPPVIETRPAYLLGIVYLGVFGSSIAFTIYFQLIRTIGPAKAAYTSVLIPVIAMLLSTLFEGYRWSLLAVGGGVLVLVGLVLALRARRPNR